VLSCTGVRKSYWQGKLEVPVLRHIDLEIQAGEQVAVMGASGTGKSTLLHVLGGLDQPDAGEVRIAGDSLWTLSDQARSRLRNRTLGFVYHSTICCRNSAHRKT
jgi:lipoprotein-releasing system ATP-binding protein